MRKKLDPQPKVFCAMGSVSRSMKVGLQPLVLGCCLGLALPLMSQADLVRNPTSVGATFDFGQIVRGFAHSQQLEQNEDDRVVNRVGVYVTQSGTYADRLSVQLTVGGLFWYAIPRGTTYIDHLVKFGPGVGQAQGQYKFGSDPKNPAATLQFGFFPMKYNPDAKNLGEYLFRGSAYPTYMQTGGWSIIDNAQYFAQGARLTVPMLGGAITNDFTLFMERDLEPTGDLDPGYLITVKPASFFEFGGGVVFTHALPFQSEKDISGNGYSAWGYDPNTGLPLNMDTVAATDTAYYTFHSIKLMARASVDLGMLLNTDAIAPGDFKLYGEWAWLGVKDYPYYYKDAYERMPVMIGIDIPTFKWLDKLSLETEYHYSRYQDNLESVLVGPAPIPAASGIYTQHYDNFKWSIYFRRHIIQGVSLVGQVANDHFRPFDLNAAPSTYPVTDNEKLPWHDGSWYYLLRLELGM